MYQPLHFANINRNDLTSLVTSINRPSWSEENKSRFLSFIDQVIRYDPTQDINPSVNSKNIFDALTLLKKTDPLMKFKMMINSLNEGYKSQFPNYYDDDFINQFVNDEMKRLAVKHGIPFEVLPNIQLFAPLHNNNSPKDCFVAGYQMNINVIFLDSDTLQSPERLISSLNHEFKHFLDSLEVKKLKLHNPDIFMATVDEFILEHSQGLDLALYSFKNQIHPNALLRLIGFGSQSMLQLDSHLDKTILDLIFKKLRSIDSKDFESFTFTSEDIQEITHSTHSSLEQSQQHFYTLAETRERVEQLTNRFSNSSNLDRYLYFQNMDENQINKSKKLLKATLQNLFSNTIESDSLSSYDLNEDEASARIYQASMNLRGLIADHKELKDVFKTRPYPNLALDLQPLDWLEEISQTVIGERAIEQVTSIRANSKLLQLSRSLRSQAPIQVNLHSFLESLKSLDLHYEALIQEGKPIEFIQLLKNFSQNNIKFLSDNSGLTYDHKRLIDSIPVSHWVFGFSEIDAISIAQNPIQIDIQYDNPSVIHPNTSMSLVSYVVFRARENLSKSNIDVSPINEFIREGNYKSALIYAWNQGQREDEINSFINEWNKARIVSH